MWLDLLYLFTVYERWTSIQRWLKWKAVHFPWQWQVDKCGGFVACMEKVTRWDGGATPQRDLKWPKVGEPPIIWIYILFYNIFDCQKRANFAHASKLPHAYTIFACESIVTYIIIYMWYVTWTLKSIKKNVLGLDNLHECANFDHQIIRPARSRYRFWRFL